MNKTKQRMMTAGVLLLVIVAGVVWWTRTPSVTETDEPSTFMSYAGPVLPLQITKPNASVTVERTVTLDCSQYDAAQADRENRNETETNVEDRYLLHNPTEEEQTLQLSYPSCGRLLDTVNRMPRILVDGDAVQTQRFAGDRLNEIGAEGYEEKRSYEDYIALLRNGSYREKATEKFPDLNRDAMVYEFRETAADTGKWPAATLAVSFHTNENTQVLTYGFDGFQWDEKGPRTYSFFVPKEGTPAYSQRHDLIVLGEDITEPVWKGYETGAMEKEIPVESALTRRETKLDEVLRSLLQDHVARWDAREGEKMLSFFSEEDYLGWVSGFLLEIGAVDKQEDRHIMASMLEDVFSQNDRFDRVFFQDFTVQIPAGESVEVVIEQFKDASLDYAGSGSKNEGVYGYDLLPAAGVSLPVTELTLRLVNAESIAIVRQNIGFTENDDTVTPDPAEEHYYVEIERKP